MALLTMQFWIMGPLDFGTMGFSDHVTSEPLGQWSFGTTGLLDHVAWGPCPFLNICLWDCAHFGTIELWDFLMLFWWKSFAFEKDTVYVLL